MEETSRTVAQPHRFSYVRYDQASIDIQESFRKKVEELELLAEQHLPPGRPKALFLTALEEAYMWSGKGIRDAQIARLGSVDEQKERNDE